MAGYAYIQNASKIKEFLEKIPNISIPDKLTYKKLEELGFKSSNDRRLVGIMKAIKFIDDTGKPTRRWKEYRDKSKARKVLAEGIREHYHELFGTYPDAYQKDKEALNNFFRPNTKVGARALDFMILTFQTLVGMADFSGLDKPQEIDTMERKKEIPQTLPGEIKKEGYTININIQLTLPETDNPEVYNEFFKAFKKHLLS